jgi:5-methylcytosine-specific restriction endonuclease McrA
VSRTWAKGSTRQWRRIRARVLARDGYQCKVQIEGVCTTKATCVHHTQGRAVTGDDERYLQAACQPCNLAIGDPAKRDPQPRSVTRW